MSRVSTVIKIGLVVFGLVLPSFLFIGVKRIFAVCEMKCVFLHRDDPYEGCWWEWVCTDTTQNRRVLPGEIGCGVGCAWGPFGDRSNCYCCTYEGKGSCGGGGGSPVGGGGSPVGGGDSGGGGSAPIGGWPTLPPAPTATPIPPPPTPTPIPKVEVSGTVYDDPLGIANGLTKCTGPGTPFKPGGGSQVRVDPDGRDGPVQGNGNYVVNQVLLTGIKTIAISGMDSGYNCSCPSSCQYTASLEISGTSDWNFYVSNILAKWAQVVGGHVHAQTGAIVKVPANNYFMIKSGFSNNPGAATKTSGNITTFPGSLSTTNWNLTDALAQTTWRYAYQRLWVRAGSPSQDPGDGNSPPPAGIYRKTGDWRMGGPGWQGMAGSRVIFVDGNVVIESKVTLSGTGGFLAVIVSGDIEVDPAVGDSPLASPAPGDADLVGAFLANGDFQAGTTLSQTDKQLVIYGTVGADIDMNGSGKVRFQRDMGVNNAVGPGVSVIWNPNLLLNFPDQMTDALTDWREVAP